MIHLIVLLNVNDAENVDKVRELLTQCCRLSRAEPGCARFEVYHSKNDPTQFVLNEHWESQAALDAHRQAQAYTEYYQPQVLPLVSRVPHPSTLLKP